MGKAGNKKRKRTYARQPQSQEEIEMSYPPVGDDNLPALSETFKAVIRGEPVIGPKDPDKLQIELPRLSEITKGKPRSSTIIVDDKGVATVKKDGPDPVKTTTPVKKHRVSVMADHRLVFPELYAAIHLTGPHFDQHGFPELFARAHCHKAKSLEEADIVVFTGGADVDPALYGASRHEKTFPNTDRDDEEMTIYLQCLELGIPMLGVCRGAQFLHVMNGGKLYQHVNNHNGDHHMWDRDEKIMIDRVSSVHHQMCMPNVSKGQHIIATAGISTEKWMDDTRCTKAAGLDIEAFFYRETVCLGIQGHPEYRGYNYFAYWTMKKINNFFFQNPDLEYRDGVRRLKEDLIAQRTAGLKMDVDDSPQQEVE